MAGFTINSYRSAISSVHKKVDEVPIGQHPIVIRLVKGIFNVSLLFLGIQVHGLYKWF